MYNIRSHIALEIPLKESNLRQKRISFIGPSLWNKLSSNLKVLNTATPFTRSCKKVVFQNGTLTEIRALRFFMRFISAICDLEI